MAIKFAPKPDPEPIPAAKKAPRVEKPADEALEDAAPAAKPTRPRAKKPAKPAAEKDGELF